MPQQSPADIARAFYTAFQARDAAAMGALYADHATFEDPAFGVLDAAEARAMWAMLIARGKDLRLSHEILGADTSTARVRWIADYTFSQTKRPVRNVIDATMTCGSGRIVRHVDSFDFWAWSRQALGIPGLLLGWTPFLRAKVRAQARAGLHKAMGRA